MARNRFQSHELGSGRFYFATIVVIVSGAVIIGRLFYLQVYQYAEWSELDRRQHAIKTQSEIVRGNIYFRDEKNNALVLAATTQKGYALFVDTRSLKDEAATLAVLQKITPIDTALYQVAVSKKNDPYEVIKPRISLEEGAKIQALRLSGIGLEEKFWRFYPGSNLASHIIGFNTATKAGERGVYGVEKYYNDVLTGSNHVADKSIFETIVSSFQEASVNDHLEGDDIILTIEPVVQRTAESEMRAAMEKWHADRAGMIVLEPATGKIKALVALPDYNLNESNKQKDFDIFLNPFVEKVFEMGSVFKPLTMAAALDTGAVTPDVTYVDTGQVKVGDRTISNFDGKGRGLRTMTQILEGSLNTGSVFVSQRLGKENLKMYFENYGLGEKTGIDVPGEVMGNLTNLRIGHDVEYATASFGQGVAVTPLELTMALSSLGNGGKRMRPYIVESTSSGYTAKPQVAKQVISSATSKTITTMLVSVVDKVLAGGRVRKDGYTIAAKTGTAQIAGPNGIGYSATDYLHSYFGYFPAYQPRFIIVMFLERPRQVRYASETLTDPFIHMTDFLINYYTIPPDRGESSGVKTTAPAEFYPQ
jgi:cell division protein FtsI (penicillin-binding protein 3)/stage V sporulation protein D (sporulation-specific penicillin-binding protein)